MNGTDPNIKIVQAWHDALNNGDLDRLTALMQDDVAFGGPRGEGRGAAEVRDWAERSGIRLEPGQQVARGDTIVVAQRASWLDPATGEPGPPQEIASVFQLRDDLIGRVARYGNLAEALAAVGIDTGQSDRQAPQVINLTDLPYVGTAHELEGYLHGGAPVCLIVFDGPPGSGPRLHRHPYTEVFIVQEGQATFTVGDATIEVVAGQIALAPAGVPHKFINSGTGPLRQIDIHCNDRFNTEWLDD
jgi:mannose-6-phosphate isomerase-like protein (cupin superfamily)